MLLVHLTLLLLLLGGFVRPQTGQTQHRQHLLALAVVGRPSAAELVLAALQEGREHQQA